MNAAALLLLLFVGECYGKEVWVYDSASMMVIPGPALPRALPETRPSQKLAKGGPVTGTVMGSVVMASYLLLKHLTATPAVPCLRGAVPLTVESQMALDNFENLSKLDLQVPPPVILLTGMAIFLGFYLAWEKFEVVRRKPGRFPGNSFSRSRAAVILAWETPLYSEPLVTPRPQPVPVEKEEDLESGGGLGFGPARSNEGQSPKAENGGEKEEHVPGAPPSKRRKAGA